MTFQVEAGLWFVPVPSLGTQLDPDTLKVAVAIRVSAVISEPHTCYCGRRVEVLGLKKAGYLAY